MSEGIDGGRVFRQAWIDGVRAHYPGDPKPGYVAPWEETPDWERQSAASVSGQVLGLLTASDGAAAHLTRAQKGQFIAASSMFVDFRGPIPSQGKNIFRRQVPPPVATPVRPQVRRYRFSQEPGATRSSMA